ncbi:pyridoxamine 5'-phosphate oxidase family protein [Amycolatopsis cynarae]|uniref:Pyridoxamine 5'-phosphate oxidase family protein n=1 Tax=Amycolatopsis cynarae TaxID=2995223 RepID=A0ABY7BCW0_9PSEU|nr:pyridoxamine 5'-phosphate oxidase family protein [Amycolatopsis sp. HUAS 11-8]WAL69082.1 pyridoxamine 5'-phosphate oxidase family protein [Amycolatopsis sp. HUAS 11-8]
MSTPPSPQGELSAVGFHGGELAVQRRAGVTALAARLSGMLAPAELRGGIVRFLADRTFAAVTARDRAGRLWISPLAGPPGFLSAADPTTLRIHALPATGDPLHDLAANQPIGLLVIDFAVRRRIRINGHLSAVDRTGLSVAVEQAYGNCPQYIQQRRLVPAHPGGHPAEPVRQATVLTADDWDLIRRADTLLVGTTHPTRGNDASHRGGPPGFVRVEHDHIWWPDYPGNNLFNSLGNLAIDATAALLFADYGTGRTLHLSGTAAVDWTDTTTPADEGGTGRRIRFTSRYLAAGHLLPLRPS